MLGVVSDHPGIHLRGLERETGLALGQVLYHLDRLERMGVLVSARDGGFRRYYPARGIGRAEKRFLGALRQEMPRRVLLALLAGGELRHRELLDRLGVAASTLSFHLQRLLASGVVTRRREGASNVYSIADPALVRRELIFFRESFRDPEVDRYVRGELERALVPS